MPKRITIQVYRSIYKKYMFFGPQVITYNMHCYDIDTGELKWAWSTESHAELRDMISALEHYGAIWRKTNIE